MNPLLARRLRFTGFLVVGLGITGCILMPLGMGGARHNARRSFCQSNLKQISLAVRQYVQDYDGDLPSARWGVAVLPYLKSEEQFYCPETSFQKGTSDYFWNARFLGAQTASSKTPATLILTGDGANDSPLNITLAPILASWRTDESSPAWRHLDMANYAFAGGHARSLKINPVNRDFRKVT